MLHDAFYRRGIPAVNLWAAVPHYVSLAPSPRAALALCERLGDLSNRLQSLSFEPAIVRLLRTLLILADTLGEAAPGGTQIVPYVRQEELAQMIAARREVVSGLLNRLRADGLIDYPRKGHISVHRNALKAYLDSLTGRPA